MAEVETKSDTTELKPEAGDVITVTITVKGGAFGPQNVEIGQRVNRADGTLVKEAPAVSEEFEDIFIAFANITAFLDEAAKMLAISFLKHLGTPERSES
jgi:hypothetical protein